MLALIFVDNAGVGDVTGPVLGPITGLSVTADGITLSCSTDDTTGTAYLVIDESATEPSAAEMRLGQNGEGGAADYADSDSSIGASPISFVVTGLTPATTYNVFIMQDDTVPNASNIRTLEFTTRTIVAATSGTLPGVEQTVVVASGGTVDLTLTWDTYLAAGTGPIGTIAQSQAIVDGFTSAQAEAGGWNAQIRDVLTHTAITRVNNTTARLTIPATAGYSITATETITPTIPAAVLTLSASPVVASTFSVLSDEQGGSGGMSPVIMQRLVKKAKERRKKKRIEMMDHDKSVEEAIAELYREIDDE